MASTPHVDVVSVGCGGDESNKISNRMRGGGGVFAVNYKYKHHQRPFVYIYSLYLHPKIYNSFLIKNFDNSQHSLIRFN